MELKNNILSCIRNHKQKNIIVKSPSDDNVLNEVLSMFENKVGAPYLQKELDLIYSEGAERYKNLIPPGYKDKPKEKRGVNSQYNDLVIWKQMIEFSKKHAKPIIFISNDKKEDWWYEYSGKTVSPRTELIREFYLETNQKFYMYTMKTFLQYYAIDNNSTISNSVYDEISKLDEAIYIPTQLNIDDHRVNSIKLKNKKREESLAYLKKKFEKTKNPNIAQQIVDTEKQIKHYDAMLLKFWKEKTHGTTL